MTRTLFDTDWQFSRAGEDRWSDVDLPHDAMIGERRDPASPSGAHGGWFPGGSYVYRKQWRAPETGERVSLLFEGVYRKSRVFVNGIEAGGCLGGYTEFEVDLHPHLGWGEDNVIEVHVDNSESPNSRWYSGSGIYRHVWLLQQPHTRLAPGGIHLVTRTLGDRAVVEVSCELDNPGRSLADVRVRLSSDDAAVAEATTRLDGGLALLALTIPDPRPWSAEDPFLHDLHVELLDGNEVIDAHEAAVGLRTITADATRGFLVNDEPVLLRGGCIHHDNGILGAATFRDAEFRRARILKEQGFNSVRSAHNPISRDFLDACDQLGLYVMDESCDMWFQSKTEHDAASHFEQTWREDLTAMVRKDRLHPSVVMYSIGNEIAESGTPEGIRAAGEMVALVRELDGSIPTTCGVNLMMNMLAARGVDLFKRQDERREQQDKKKERARSPLTSTGYNYLVSKISSLMARAAALPGADRASRGVFDAVDVAGYNYASARYRKDGRLHPGRVIVGTETMPFDIAANWTQVEELPHLVGDFMWTGWDYLGETGIGQWTYGDEPSAFAKPYPYLAAGPGAIDITGEPGAPMLLARAVWRITGAPGIAVRPLDRSGQRANRAAWRGTDAVASWAWPGCEGRIAEIEVYSDADEVELLLGGRSLGTRKAGRRHGCVARFKVPYEPGTLEAVARSDGREVGRSELSSSSGRLGLRLVAERDSLTANSQDLAFIRVEATDEAGIVAMVGGEVTVTIDGPATLAALGSADPAPLGSYRDTTGALHRGRALAVLRAGREAGTTTITATSPTLGSAEITLQITADKDAS